MSDGPASRRSERTRDPAGPALERAQLPIAIGVGTVTRVVGVYNAKRQRRWRFPSNRARSASSTSACGLPPAAR